MIRYTLTTRKGRTASGSIDGGSIVWDREGDDETASATFTNSEDREVYTISGDEWRELEDAGSLERVPVYVAAGVPLEDAIKAAIDGVDPDGYDDTREELAKAVGLLSDAESFLSGFEDSDPEDRPAALEPIRAFLAKHAGAQSGANSMRAELARLDHVRDAFESLSWIVEFCEEHPEWTAREFPADGGSEGEWLAAARRIVAAGADSGACDYMSAAEALRRLAAEAFQHDDELDDAAHDGAEARPPTGDNYNDLLALVTQYAARAGIKRPPAVKSYDGAPLPGTLGATLSHAWLDELDAEVCMLPADTEPAQHCAAAILAADALLANLPDVKGSDAQRLRAEVFKATARQCAVYVNG